MDSKSVSVLQALSFNGILEINAQCMREYVRIHTTIDTKYNMPREHVRLITGIGCGCEHKRIKNEVIRCHSVVKDLYAHMYLCRSGSSTT